MRRFRTCILTILSAILIQSCIPASTDQIEKIVSPDNSEIKKFGIDITGDIIYQFYQKYGFTDIEEQLILIVRTDNIDYLTKNLPFDSLDINRLEKIDIRKFTKGKPVNFIPEKSIQADIRLNSKEYDSNQNKSVFYNEGKYRLNQTDTTETIFVFDSQAELMYIESKKTK